MTITTERACPGYGAPCGRPLGDGGLCNDCTECKLDDEMIGDLRRTLGKAVRQAGTSTSSALNTLRNLTSNEVYDTALADDIDGEDLKHELEAALRHLRNAFRITCRLAPATIP